MLLKEIRDELTVGDGEEMIGAIPVNLRVKGLIPDPACLLQAIE